MIVVRVLGASEAHVLDNVAPDVFDHPVDAGWAADFFADPRHHLAVAIVEDRVVGMASGVHYVHPDKAPELWINEVGVASDYRRRGVATRMLDGLMAHAKALGCREAWVLTEPDNEAARALYERTGAKAEPTVLYAWRL